MQLKTMKKLNILLLEPYFTGSHASWADGYKKYSRHHVEILSLKGQFWKWRMHGGAVTLAREFLERKLHPDLILATDMLDVTTFLSLTRRSTANIPIAIYFHENQITYPWSPTDRDVRQNRDYHYGFINFTSALAADHIFFNSSYHRNAFLKELPRFLKHFPDHRELNAVQEVEKKSSVLHLGLDLKKFDHFKPEKKMKQRVPVLLWNHRWEYDKNPGDFFQALYLLDKEGLIFQVILIGENFAQTPEDFAAARKRLGDKIIQYGYAESFAEYAHWLWRADILPVTSHHDFFGTSVVEAVYCGCTPLLPRRLAYPELLSFSNKDYFYKDLPEFVEKLRALIVNFHEMKNTQLSAGVRHFDWQEMVRIYDDKFDELKSNFKFRNPNFEI